MLKKLVPLVKVHEVISKNGRSNNWFVVHKRKKKLAVFKGKHGRDDDSNSKAEGNLKDTHQPKMATANVVRNDAALVNNDNYIDTQVITTSIGISQQ